MEFIIHMHELHPKPSCRSFLGVGGSTETAYRVPTYTVRYGKVQRSNKLCTPVLRTTYLCTDIRVAPPDGTQSWDDRFSAPRAPWTQSEADSAPSYATCTSSRSRPALYVLRRSCKSSIPCPPQHRVSSTAASTSQPTPHRGRSRTAPASPPL